MKLLGYLFVFACVLAVVGYARGWFTVSAATKGSSGLQVAMNRDQMASDADAVMDRVGASSAGDSPKAAPAAVATHVVQGRITAVTMSARQIAVAVAAREAIYHVPTSVPILRGGEPVGFDQLRSDLQVRLTFDSAEAIHALIAVEIMP